MDRRVCIVIKPVYRLSAWGVTDMSENSATDGNTDDGADARSRFLTAAAAQIAAGNPKFSVSFLCRKAGLDRAAFHAHFASRAALLAALDAAATQGTPEKQAAPEKQPVAEGPQPMAAAPDAWLERRLRVFERALTALEARAEATGREQALTIARLEEQVRLLTQAADGHALRDEEELTGAVRTLRVANGGMTHVAVPARPGPPDLEAAISAAPAEAPDIHLDAGAASGAEMPALSQTVSRADLVLPPAPPSRDAALARQEMAQLLEEARHAARATAENETVAPKPRSRWRPRWLALGCLGLVALFAGAGLTLDGPAKAIQAAASGSGVSHRQVPGDSFGRMAALADNGNAAAQAGMALAYLRGTDKDNDPRAALHWAGQAARAGNPVGQYLVGALYHQGEGVRADPAIAFRWFAAAARRGNVKAMHNLAIAYAEGLGTEKNAALAAQWFTRAAERGYVDSAFDLAVLYERGDGVAQDAAKALAWYQFAARAGDKPSAARAAFLRGQMDGAQRARAENALRAIADMAPLAAANRLPVF